MGTDAIFEPSGDSAVAIRSSDFSSKTAFTRARSGGWLGRAWSDGGAPGSGVDRCRYRRGVGEAVMGGIAIGHIESRGMQKRHRQRFLRKKRCDDAARATRGEGCNANANALTQHQGNLTAAAAALSLSPRMPSLTQDCLRVPETIAVGGTPSISVMSTLLQQTAISSSQSTPRDHGRPHDRCARGAHPPPR